MIKDIGFYDDLTTPYYYSYSPYKKMWYEDAKEQLPEPDTLPEEVEHFSFKDTLEDWRTEPETIKEEFEKYIQYIFGAKELFGYDGYSASLLLKSPKYEREICINCAWEFEGLENFIEKAETDDYISHYMEAHSGVKFFVWKKDNNKIRFIAQSYGIGECGHINYDYLTIDYDVLVDKDEFVNEFRKFINKYKNLLLDKIKEYEIQDKITFTNPFEFSFIDDWILEKKQKGEL